MKLGRDQYLKILNHKSASDRNCNCGLKLGSSCWFKAMIQQQIAKHVKVNLNLENVFDDVLGKEVYARINRGASRCYQDVISGDKKNLTLWPPVFQYNSRIGVHDTIVPETLVEIAQQLKSKRINSSEVKKIERFLEDIQPQIAEF